MTTPNTPANPPSDPAAEAAPKPRKEKLLPFSGSGESGGGAHDLNAKIAGMESALTKLEKRLATSTKSMQASIKKGEKNHDTLDAGLSKTKDQIGAIDLSLASLSTLTTRLSEANQQVSQELIKGLTEQQGRIEEGADQRQQDHQQLQGLIERSTLIEERLQGVTLQLAQASEQGANSLRELELRLEQQQEAIKSSINTHLEQAVAAQNAVVVALQAELASKAVALEQGLNQAQVTIETQQETLAEQQQITETLQQSTYSLHKQGDALQQQAVRHGMGISFNTRMQHRNYRLLGGSMLLLALVVGVMFALNHNQHAEEQATITTVEQTFIQHTTQQQQSLVALMDTLEQELGGVRAELNTQRDSTDGYQQENQRLQQTINGLEQQLSQLNSQLEVVDEQAQNIDGRLTALAPNRNFGRDNTIRNSTWLAQQDPTHFAIYLTTVTEKQQLYTLAQRHGPRLQQELAFLEGKGDESSQFALFYGNFVSQQEAEAVLRRMPRMDPRTAPRVVTMQDIQQAI